jgi:triosephosphate isomerase (TIM)
MIIVNFKIYKQTFGDGAIRLAKICKSVAEKTGVKIVVAVSALDAYRVKKETGTEVFLQDFDQFDEGRHTGFISANQAKDLGIEGSIINHSEKNKAKGLLLTSMAKKVKDFETVLCVKSVGQIETWGKKARADYIAYEPKHLIASKTKSVASEQASTIKRAVEACGKIPVLVGAGIKSGKDVEVSLKMGAMGVLVATDIVCSKDPEKELLELAEGFGL